jgi:hypothetical protein
VLAYFAESPTHFFTTVNTVTIDFERDANGHIGDIFVHLVGCEQRMPRNP